ncbi:translocation/assembly module TamB domain-containing protein [Mangrovibacterium sp.]|uniref:translocation/assembly module TamB domain-containing protein n=1 Tax=Mangrovibacterium sp. TaxID=1961364 RepID=UPI0035685ADC
MRKYLIIAFRSLFWLIAGLIGLFVLLTIVIQTPPAKRQIVQIAEMQAEKFIDGELTIGKLEGNFWNQIRLSQISLVQNTDTIASIGELNLEYQLWPLLKRKLVVRAIELKKPRLQLIQINDSTWNFERLLIEQSESDSTQIESSPLTLMIDLQKFEIDNGLITINASDSLIPEQVKNLNIQLQATYSDEIQDLRLNHISFQTTNPDLQLQQLHFNLKREKGSISLTNFALKTGKNEIDVRATYAESSPDQSSIRLETKPLNTSEFAFVLPELKIKVSPQINWESSLHNDSLVSKIQLIAAEQEIRLNIRANHFTRWLYNPDSTELTYALQAELKQVKMNEWTGLEDLNYYLSGSVHLNGAGTDPKKLLANLKAEFRNSNFAGYAVNRITANANYQAGSLQSNIRLNASFGQIVADATLKELFNTPRYQLRVSTSELNLAPILNNSEYTSNINLTAAGSGTGFDLKKIRSSAQIRVQPSTLMGIPIDSAMADLTVASGVIGIDRFEIHDESLGVYANGHYALSSATKFQLTADIRSLDSFKKFLPEATIQTEGKLTAQIDGTPDSLNINSNLVLAASQYDEFRVDSARLSTTGILLKDGFTFDNQLKAKGFHSSFLILDSIQFDSRVHPDSLTMLATIQNREIYSRLESKLNWKNQFVVRMHEWLINVKDQEWKLANPASLLIDSLGYQINNFSLTSGGNQAVKLNGVFSQTGAEDLKLQVEQLNLAELLKTLEMDHGISGFLNLDVDLDGSASKPVIASTFKVDSAAFGDYRFKKADGQIAYSGNQLDLATAFELEKGGRLTGNAEIPATIALDSMKVEVNPDTPVNGTIQIFNLPLALVRPFLPADEIRGLINGEVNLKGSINSPQPSGSIQLTDGHIAIPDFGIEYKDMLLKTSFSRDIISLDTLGIRSSDGFLSGGGKVFFDSGIHTGKIKESTIKFKINSFNPIDHKQINMQVSGDASLNGNQENLVFGGNLTIPQSEIYLPALLNLFGKVYTPEIPPSILVEELHQQTNEVDSLWGQENSLHFSDSVSVDYFKNLSGKIKINIPKNTWIKDPNLRIELSGDLEIMKNNAFVEIFGSINVVRGQYELFGRTFIVQEGVISFEGGEEINPTLNLTAEYTIKSRDSESQVLQAMVEGEAMNPTVSFTLDDESITEGDALSYIVFGRGISELNSSDQAQMSDATGESMAKSAAASLLASQLTKLLGKKLNVDYIQVKSQDNLDNTSLEVGKYLTNDLFLSYEQQFGATTDYDLSRYEVKLEYEIFRFLFLQLNNSTNDSGFDIIIKIQSD